MMNYKLKNDIKKILFNSEAGHKLYSGISSVIRKNRSSLSDEEYVKKAFKENTGKTLDLSNPKTFNEKLLWLSLHDHDPLKTKCADKVAVREYIKDKGYDYILTNLYGVYNHTSDIEFEKMPQRFFVKTNHDSGTYALIDKDDPDSFSSLNRIEKALGRNYYYESREWQYKDINPKVLCEEYIVTEDPAGLIDYRFYCFGGNIGFIAVDVGTTSTNGKHSYVAKRNLYDSEFNLLDAKLKRDHFDPDLITKPENFEQMKLIAKDLSADFKHVRVDFYNVKGRIIFGELTFCNGGGMQLLEPDEFNRKIGDLMIL